MSSETTTRNTTTEEEETLTIRMGTTDRFTITVSNFNATILQVKQKIALKEAAGYPESDRQRLIFKGRILNDDTRTLSDYGVTNESTTLHLVKGRASHSSGGNAAATTTPTTNPIPNPAPMNNTPMPNLNSLGSINEMQQQLMQNPQMVQNMMSNPMVQSLMSNPDFMRNMMEQNPEMRRVMDDNPQLRHLLQDPDMMRRSLEMMRDPSALQNMMRNQDLAMSQIENLPGGFSALRRMYEDIQEPMMDAMAGSSNTTSNQTPFQPSNNAGVGGAMPNPWSSSPNSNATPPPANPSNTPSTFNAPNPWTNPASNNANPVNPGMSNPNMMQMLNNPYIQQMMDQLLQDPNMLQAITQSNPYLQQMSQNNPAAAAMLQNPEVMRATMSQFQQNPNMLQNPMFQQQQQQQQQSPPNPNLDFSSLLTQFQNTSVTPPAPPPNDEQRYQFPLQSLQDMGFDNRDQNLRILRATNGNVNRAVERLLEEGPAAAPAAEESSSTDATN